jgi:hypothetical protein
MTPVMREEAAKVTSCFFEALLISWNERDVK